MTSPKKQSQKPARRHHYTPVLYLQHFTDEAGALHVVNPLTGALRQSSPDALGFERDLYWPDDLQDGEDPESYEHQFSEFESKAAPVIQQIIESRTMPTETDALELLFNFIAFQFVRTPSTKRVLARPMEQVSRIIMNLLENDRSLYENVMRQSGGDLKAFPHERIKASKGTLQPRLTTEGFINHAMTMMETIIPFLYRRTWTVLVSERPGESFVVSDHPVVLEWSDPNPTGRRRMPPGHAFTNTELTIPLGSHVALIGCYTPFTIDPLDLRLYIGGVNSRTISHARTFIAACEDDFLLQDNCQIITSTQYLMTVIEHDQQKKK